MKSVSGYRDARRPAGWTRLDTGTLAHPVPGLPLLLPALSSVLQPLLARLLSRYRVEASLRRCDVRPAASGGSFASRLGGLEEEKAWKTPHLSFRKISCDHGLCACLQSVSSIVVDPSDFDILPLAWSSATLSLSP